MSEEISQEILDILTCPVCKGKMKIIAFIEDYKVVKKILDRLGIYEFDNTNILIFIGAWSTTKVPMLLFEISALRARFALLRQAISIPGIIIIAYALYFLLSEKDKVVLKKKLQKMNR